MKKNKLILTIFLILIFGLLAWGITVYIPPIKGRVIEADTGKPMKGVNVRAGWVTGYADPGGGSFRTFKVYATKTDEDGEFVLPWRIKLKIPIIEHYQGVNMLIYEHGYAALYRETVGGVYALGETDNENTKINKHSSLTYVTELDYEKNLLPSDLEFKLKAITTEQDYIKNIGHLISNLSSRTVGEDISFTIKEYQIILQKFPSVKDAYIYHQSLGYLHETYEKNYEAAINEYKKSILKNKNSSFASELQTKIVKFQNILERQRKKREK